MIGDIATGAAAAVILGAAVYATEAYPQETVTFGDGYYGAPMPPGGTVVASTVTIGPSQFPGAIAKVTFHNVGVNDGDDTGQTRQLVGQGVTVGVEFTYTSGADSIVLSPPDGVMCHPSCTITLEEETSGSVTLYDATAVGM